MDKDIDRPFENQIWAKAEIIAKRYNIRIEENAVLGYVANSQEMPCVWADGMTLANCLASSIRAHTVAVATMLEFGNEPPIPMRDRPLGEYNKIDIVLHNIDTTVNSGGLPQVTDTPPMPKCKPPKPEEDKILKAFDELEEEMFKLHDVPTGPKEVQITSIDQIIDKLTKDGDLREHEFHEERICCEGDDLGFYQQACAFLIEKKANFSTEVSSDEMHEAMEGEFDGIELWVVVQELLELRKKVATIQTCKEEHKFVANSHEYVCPHCVIDKIREKLS